MKTTFLLNTDCSSVVCFNNGHNVSLKKRNKLKFNIDEGSENHTDHTNFENTIDKILNTKPDVSKNTLKIDITSSYSNNCLLSYTLAEVLPIIQFLYSLRCYFKKKINTFFCDECLAYFRQAILCNEFQICKNCRSHLQISDLLSILYSTVYPFESRAFIMVCLCKRPVFRQRQYIQCGCISSHKHVDHENILKTVVKIENKLWNKLCYVSSLTSILQDNISVILSKLNQYRNIHMLPLQKIILNPETQALKLLLYKSCSSLYQLLKNNAHLSIVQNVVKHFKYFIKYCNSGKLVLSKLRVFFRDFELFFERTLKNISYKDCYKFKEIKKKKKLSFNEYSDYLLFFGLYSYFLEIIKFCREKSFSISSIFLKFMGDCRKQNMMYILFQICDLHYCNLFKSEATSLFKTNVQDVELKQCYLSVNELAGPSRDIETINNDFGIHKSEEEINRVRNVKDLEEQITIESKMTVSHSKCPGRHKGCSKWLETDVNLENQLKETISSNSHQLNKMKNVPQLVNTITTGKEEMDVIDGINIYSFETESDMTEFSMLHTKQMLSQSDNEISGGNNRTSLGRIIPTKTHDITKIKGWRNKLFCTDKNEKRHLSYLKNISVTPTKCIQLKRTKSPSPKIKEEPFNEEVQTKGELQRYNNDIKSEENNNIILKKELPECTPLDTENNKGFNKLVIDLVPLYLQVLSEDMIIQDLSKQIERGEYSQGIFQSSILDEYLQNNSKLAVSFGISKHHNSSPSFHNRKTKSLLPIDIHKPNASHFKGNKTESKTVDFSSTDFIKNMVGDSSNRKFIWVRGRPIMIEVENRKTTSNINSKKRAVVSLDSDFGETIYNVEEENYLKREKITKQLDSPKAFLSKNGCSLLNEGYQLKNKKSYLSLLNTVKIDDIDEKYIFHSESLVKPKFPLIFPCTSLTNRHCSCTKFSNIQLGMVVNIGYGRPFLEEVLNNVEQLKTDVNIVDNMWAHIAASAVCSNSSRRVTRYIVPVVSDSLIEVVKFSIENVSTNISKINESNVNSIYKSICTVDAYNTGVDKSEIKDVLEDIVDYVVKKGQYELLAIPYDPDVPNPTSNIKIPAKKAKKSKVERELKRLINVTLVDDWLSTDEASSTNNSCGNEHCIKGCICSSLNGKLTILHCGKSDCMFECSCDSKMNQSFSNIIHRRNRVVLAKEESRWHQTVICKNNEVIEIKAETGKSKREKKLPTRFRNNVLLGKEMNCLDLSPLPSRLVNSKSLNKSNKLTPTNKVRNLKTKDKDYKRKEKDKEEKDEDKELKNKEIDFMDKETNAKLKDAHGSKITLALKTTKINSKPKAIIPAHLKQVISKVDLKKMVKIFREESNHPLTLADVFVWCSIHLRYSCSCSGQIFILKNNKLMWKPSAKKTYLTAKCMSQIVIDNAMPKYHAYDRNGYSARTFGSIFNYKLRNSSPIFKCKRLNEILNFVLSNTNSFIKVDFTDLELHSKSIKQEPKPETNEIKTKKINLNRMSQSINSNEVINKHKYVSPAVKNNVTSFSKKRKGSALELEDIIESDKINLIKSAIEPKKRDIIIKNKKKYRIGPAHFDQTGSHRTIVIHLPTNNAAKSEASDELLLNETDKEIVSACNVNDTEKDNAGQLLPKYGLLCLTQGFGYLPVKEFTQKKLQVQDPLSENVFHCFKDVDSANKWLNRFFKNHIVFESLDVNLKWVIVKPGILKYSYPFNKSLVEDSLKIVNKNGHLVERSKDNGGSYQLHLEESTSKSQLVNVEKSTKRTLTESNGNIQDIEEMLPKKVKISPFASRKEMGVNLNHETKKTYPIKKTTGNFQGLIPEEISCTRTAKKPTEKNHSTFFRLNDKPDFKVSRGCFVPLAPPKTSNEYFQPQNVNATKCSETGQKLISNVFSPSSSSCSNSSSSCTSPSPVQFNTNIKNLVVSHLGRTVPISVKALSGKSILKTKLK